MKHVFLTFFIFCSSFCVANKDFITSGSVGNTDIYCVSMYSSEINFKPFILANYINLLAKKYNFKDKIVIDFRENFGNKDSTFVFFSDNYYDLREIKHDNSLNIRIRGRNFDLANHLNLVESILIKFNFKKNNFKLLVLFEKDLKSFSKNSDFVNSVLSNKVYRTNDVHGLKKFAYINYYYKNGKYYFYNTNKENETLYILESFIDFYDFYDEYDSLAVIVENENKILVLNSKLEKLDEIVTKEGASIGYFNVTFVKRKYLLIFEIRYKVLLYDIRQKIIVDDFSKRFNPKEFITD